MTALARQWTRFSRFSMVGILGGALQIVLFDLLVRRLHLSGATAAATAVEIVLLHNFFWHERFTWRDRGGAGFRVASVRLWRFHASNGLVSVAGNTVLAFWFVECLKIPTLLSAVLSIAICAPVNFFLADRLVYVQPGTRIPPEQRISVRDHPTLRATDG